MKNSSVLGLKLIFFLNISFKKIKERVYSSICFTLTIIDSKMVIKELLGPANLTKAQTLYVYELLEVIMVSKNEYLVFTIFWVVLLGFKSFNNSEKLTVLSFVPNLGRNHFL